MKNSAMPSFTRRGLVLTGLAGMLLPTSTLLSACGGGGGSDSVSVTPRLASVDNFRDLAGTDDASAYVNTTGSKMRRGVFYRSNALAASDADLTTLSTLGIVTVYDLRTPAEIQKTPDRVPTGTKDININVMGAQTAATPSFNSPAEAIAFMEATERSFVTDEGVRARFGQLFTAMAEGASAQLFHCSAGKDRTGWTAALLQCIAGLSQEAIVQDYLLTNTYSAASIQATYAALVKMQGQQAADSYYPLLGVQKSFLMAGLDQVVASYGTMDAYLTKGLGLSQGSLALLKNKLIA